ncbi:hypothetical protein BC940DRAFT_309015 [Gongronella butleri]|nr:hypothetical protein BC940DRAFT_309015 [Gongronella butleri]
MQSRKARASQEIHCVFLCLTGTARSDTSGDIISMVPGPLTQSDTRLVLCLTRRDT